MAASNAMRTRVLSGLMVCLSLTLNVRAAELTVILPTNTQWPSNYQQWAVAHDHVVTLHHFTQVDAIEDRFKVHHNGDEAGAEQQIKTSLIDAVNDELIEAWQIGVLIWQYELNQLPAIVIDQKAVYYGLNPRLAIEAYQRKGNSP